MKRKLFFILSIILFVVPTISYATDWVVIDENKEFTTSIDRKSINKRYFDGSPFVVAWFYMQNTPTNTKTKVTSSKRLIWMNCKERIHSDYIQRIDYDRKGKVVYSNTIPINQAEFHDVIPDSILDEMQHYACLGSLVIDFFQNPNLDELAQEYPHQMSDFIDYLETEK